MSRLERLRPALPQRGWAGLAVALIAAALLGPLCAPARAVAAGSELRLVHPAEAPPYFYVDAQGQPGGLLVQYWRLWSDKAGVRVRFVPARSQQEALAMLEKGEADMHAGLAATPELEARLALSRPMLDLGLGIYAVLADGADLSAMERESAVVGLVAGEPSAAFLSATLPGLAARHYPDLQSLALALSLGHVRIAAGPTLLLRHQLEAAMGGGFRLVRSFPGVQLRAALPKGEAELLARVNAGVEELGQVDAVRFGSGWGRRLWGLPVWLWHSALSVLAIAAAVAALLSARRKGRQAEARVRESELLQANLMAEMARHRKTQDLLLSAIEQSPSGILIAYADPAIPAVYNNQALRLLGLPAPLRQMPAMPVPPFTVYTPTGTHIPFEELPLTRALRYGESVEGAEFRLVLSDGTERWISANAAPVRDPAGGITAAVLVFHDVSASRESERELARFKFFLDSGVEEVYLVRPDSTLAYVNEAVGRSLGRRREEFLDEPLMAIDPAYGPENFRRLLQRVREGQQTFETVQTTAAGARLTKEIKAFYMRFGEEEYVCAFGRDITARKNLLQELESTRALFEAALEQSPTGIVIGDASTGRITIVNRAAAEIVGLEAEQLRQLHMGEHMPDWSVMLHDGSRMQATDAPLIRAIANGEVTRDLEGRFVRPGQPDRWLLANAAPIRSDDGTTVAGILTLADITARKQMEDQLLFKALHDGLTGLPNRALCLERIQQVAEEAQRRGGLFAVAFIDLDHFKLLNDSLGHSFGDRVLIEAAKRLVSGVRGQDTVCRFGGDEFVLIVEGAASAEGSQEIIRGALERLREPLSVDGQEVRLTASVGVVVGPTADSPRAESILQNADVAMHRAKDAGRDRIRMFHPGMLRRAVELMALDADMRRALEQDEFLVYFQPLFSMTGAEVRGLEALVRWKSPLRGLVGPDTFIPHAEDSGLIVPLGERVLRRACATMAAWRREYPEARRIPLSVNLSAKQFAQPDIVETVRQVLAESGLPPAMLKIEITESALMADPENALTSMRRLKALGVSLAIDDFGTGYSSLSYLQRFPVDILKIDRSFVRDLPREDSDSRELARAIVALGHSLRLMVVAEGVENREQLDILAELGCEAVQGFLFSPPVPAIGVEPFLGRRAAQARTEGEVSGEPEHAAQAPRTELGEASDPLDYPKQ